MRALTWMLLLLGACKGGGTDPADDTDPVADDTDTAEPTDDTDVGPTETYTPVGFTPMEVFLPPWRYPQQGTRMFADAVSYEQFSGLTAPPELADLSQQVLVRIGNAGAFPGSIGSFTKVEKADSDGKIHSEVTWDVPGRDCSTFEIPLAVAAFSLIDPVGERPRFAVGWEWSGDHSCADGLEVDQACTISNYCKTGFICQGLTQGDTGICRPDDLHTTVDVPVGDLTDGMNEFELEFSGLATVSEDVLMQLSMTHPRASDLHISLENPAGTVVVIADRIELPRTLDLWIAVRGFPGDEPANGTWILRIDDQVSGQVGGIGPYSRVEVASRWD